MIDTISLAAMWFACGVNVAMVVRSYRARKREEQEVVRLMASFEVMLKDVTPALAFVAMLRDSASVPPELRRAAANALPANVTMTRMDEPDGRVH
jgi:hypothetical protein